MQLNAILPLGALLALPWVLPHALPAPTDPLLPPRAPGPVPALAAGRGTASLMPANTLLYLESASLSELLTEGLDHPWVESLMAAGLESAIRADHGASPGALLAELDQALGMPALPALAELTAGGAALGFGLERARPTTLLALYGIDKDRVGRVLDTVLEQVARAAGHPGAFRHPAEFHRGAPVWKIGDELWLAQVGGVVLLSNRERGLESAVDRALSPVVGDDDFKAPRIDTDDHLLFAWADLEQIERLTALGQAASREGGPGAKLRRLRRLPGQPGVQFLLGPGLASIGGARELTAHLQLRGEDMLVEFAAHGVPGDLHPSPSTSQSPSPSPGSWRVEGSEHLAELSAYRDLDTLFRQRVDRFPPETLPAFSEAISNLTLFAGGLDFEEDVLPGLSPWIRAVVRPVEFDDGARPELPLPAAALILELEDPDLGPVLVGAFQTAVGLANLERAQGGEDGLVLALTAEGEVQITSARFLPPRSGDGVDLRYNLEPACAVVGDHFLIGSHASLVAELVRAGPGQRTSQPHESLRVQGPALAEVLRANFEALVVNTMLEDGVTRKQAERDLTTLGQLLDSIRELDLAVSYPSADSVSVSATIDLTGPRQ